VAPAPGDAEVASTATPPAQEEPEVVYGRHLLPSPAKVPLPCLLAKSQQALEELEAGIHREWEELEAERLRLSNWERRLGDRIKTVSARYAGERAELALESEDLQEQLQKVLDREAAVAQRERVATRREAQAIERELAAEMKVSSAEARTKIALELTDHARVSLELIKEQQAALAEREAAVVEGEANLAVHQEELAARIQGLQEREASLQERETSLQEREAKVEEFLAERSASIGRIVKSTSEVNSSLDALGVSPIWVAEAPPSLGAALMVLDSAAERLRHLESAILDLLETEGRAVA
jgi:hypothetical protein